jgi:NodT family efflux transporter outer membrane factor (OMF) lipoprotein
LQKRLELTEENISLLERTVSLIKQRYKSGIANLLDVERIEAELSTQNATVPNIYAQLYRSIYAISVLTGSLPETLLAELLPMQPLPLLPEQIAVGLRSDILRRRPDIRYAERQLAAATADIGVAVASFFPSVHLFGQLGFQSLSFNNLFSGDSKTWSFGGDINMPIFQGGKLCGNLQANEAATSAAYFTYQQTILNALREAETALVNVVKDKETSDILRFTVEKTRKISTLTNQRYTSGLVSMTDLIDSERQLISTELSLLDNETAALNDLIALYKALGGGWQYD